MSPSYFCHLQDFLDEEERALIEEATEEELVEVAGIPIRLTDENAILF